jgi:adenosine deaminase
VVEAARLGAARVGHGVHLVDALGDPARAHLVDEVRERGVHLEVCPTSNVHTGAAPSIGAHPITALWRAGVSLSFNTDNRLMSGVSPSAEALALIEHTPLEVADLVAMGIEAARHSFVPLPQRRAAEAALREWAAARGITPAPR